MKGKCFRKSSVDGQQQPSGSKDHWHVTLTATSLDRCAWACFLARPGVVLCEADARLDPAAKDGAEEEKGWPVVPDMLDADEGMVLRGSTMLGKSRQERIGSSLF